MHSYLLSGMLRHAIHPDDGKARLSRPDDGATSRLPVVIQGHNLHLEKPHIVQMTTGGTHRGTHPGPEAVSTPVTGGLPW